MRRHEREGLHDNGDGLDHHDAANVTGKENSNLSDNDSVYDKNSQTGRMRRREREGLHGNGDGLDHHDAANVTGKENINLSNNNLMYDKKFPNRQNATAQAGGRVFTAMGMD